jgi:molybdopterin converting factor small subunit
VRVTVRYFAVLREQKKRDVEEVDVEPGTTVAELYASLFPGERVPVAYARNQAYARAAELVEDGDEVVFLPPLGGG